MATVIGKTSVKIDELLSNLVTSAKLDSTGNMIVTRRDGSTSIEGTVAESLVDDFAGKSNVGHAHSTADLTSGMFDPATLRFPPNLRGGRKDRVMNLNTDPEAIQPGFWCCVPGSSNVPPTGSNAYYMGWTVCHDPTVGSGLWVTQYAHVFSGSNNNYTQNQLWFRQCVGGTWEPWRTADIMPISHGNWGAYRSTNLPNDNVERTVFGYAYFGYPPAGAVYAKVTMSVSAHAVANAQMHWKPHIWNGAGDWWRPGTFSVHNHGNPAFDLGRTWSWIHDVRPHARNTQELTFAMNAFNDSGSGAWIDIGQMSITATWMGHTASM